MVVKDVDVMVTRDVDLLEVDIWAAWETVILGTVTVSIPDGYPSHQSRGVEDWDRSRSRMGDGYPSHQGGGE